MKHSSLSLILVRAALAGLAASACGQTAPSAEQPAVPQHEAHHHSAPTNLKVLPRDMTGDQVHDLMHDWEADLGVTCKTCHTENPKDIGPNGRPRLNYADDSKQEKQSARLMYRMLDEINSNYVAKIEGSGVPVTCGTCHQGHLNPDPYSPEDRARHAGAGTNAGATGR